MSPLPVVVPDRRALTTASRVTLFALLGLGVGLRVLVMASARPIAYGLFDSGTYLSGAVGDKSGGLFADTHHAVGYSVWLRLVGSVIDSGSQLAVVQHGVGLAAGALVFLAFWRLGAPLAVTTFAAAAVLVNPEVAQLEHSVMSEALYVPALASGFAAAALAATTTTRWFIPLALAGGALAGVAYTARYPGLAFVAVVLVVACTAGRHLDLAGRAGRAALIAIGALCVLMPYTVAQARALDMGIDFFPGQGWNRYAGIAADADCRHFTPPPATRVLCDRRPPNERPREPEYYTWNGESPALRLEPRGFPYSDEKFERFAEAAEASVAAKRDAAQADGESYSGPLARYINPARRYLGATSPLSPLSGDRNQEAYERSVAEPLLRLAPLSVGAPAATFEDVKGTWRLSGRLLFLCCVLILLGALWGRRFRLAALSCLGFAEANWVAAGGFNARYAVPIALVVVLGACLAAAGLWERRDERRRRRRELAAWSGGW